MTAPTPTAPPNCGVYIYRCDNPSKSCGVFKGTPLTTRCFLCYSSVTLVKAPPCIALAACGTAERPTVPPSMLTPIVVDARALDALRDALEGEGLRDFDRVALARKALHTLVLPPSGNGNGKH